MLLLEDARAPQSPFASEATERPHFALHGHAINPDTGKIAEYRELSQSSDGAIWQNSNCEEIGRLAQGYGTVNGTNTIHFIRRSAIPRGRRAAYLRVVSAFRPEKAKPHRVRWTVRGDKIDYPFEVSTKTADLTTAKLLFNSVLSTPEARFFDIDLKDFYLGTPMDRYEYMRVPIWMLPDAIIEQYQLTPLFDDGFVYVEIRRGMYGLPQAGRLANDQLVAFLKPHGYMPCPLPHGLWRHATRDVVFSLVVDDFGVRYTPAKTMQIISLPPSKPPTMSASTGLGHDTAGSHSSGITKIAHAIFQCPVILNALSYGSNIPPAAPQNTRHTRGNAPTMEQKPNLLRSRTPRQRSTPPTRLASLKFSERSYFTHVQSIPPC